MSELRSPPLSSTAGVSPEGWPSPLRRRSKATERHAARGATWGSPVSRDWEGHAEETAHLERVLKPSVGVEPTASSLPWRVPAAGPKQPSQPQIRLLAGRATTFDREAAIPRLIRVANVLQTKGSILERIQATTTTWRRHRNPATGHAATQDTISRTQTHGTFNPKVAGSSPARPIWGDWCTCTPLLPWHLRFSADSHGRS